MHDSISLCILYLRLQLLLHLVVGSIALLSTVLQWFSQVLVERLLLNSIVVTCFSMPVCLLDEFVG